MDNEENILRFTCELNKEITRQQLVAGLSLQRPGFRSGSVLVGVVVGKMALG
jgi:hypothetical protein